MSRIPLGTPGHVYVLGNQSMPGLLKVGATTAEPALRAKQLSAATASPTPFTVLYSRQVRDVNVAETSIHSALAAYRVNEGREFFRVSLYEAARTLDALLGETFSRFEPPTPFADLFNSFDPSDSDELTEDEQRQCRELEGRLRESRTAARAR